MYEMQGPYVVSHAADLPIAQLPYVSLDLTSCPAEPHDPPVSRSLAAFGVSSEVALR
jgi:hypothetical protein